MSESSGKFTVAFADLDRASLNVQKDRILMGRLDSCDVHLDHKTVSRIHAAINYRDGQYSIVNLSSSNVLTLNGRRLRSEQSDVLADGDTIQIGPFTMQVGRIADELLVIVDEQFQIAPAEKPAQPALNEGTAAAPELQGVLKAFWEKRTREKEDWGTRLRPKEAPIPGKAMFNWRPTRDLRPAWRIGLFVWAFLILGALGVFAYFRYPQAYAPQPLASVHADVVEQSTIAAASNGNSCTTCHTPNEPIENSCVKCHSATEFHASNTKAHEQAGITCTVCHKEHRGAAFDMKADAVAMCAECHNDSNKQLYNGKSVHTPHSDPAYGYPVVDGTWRWKGVYREVADAIPEINNSATGDKNDQARLSRQFHTIHVSRLKAPAGMKADKRGLVSCSSCHLSQDPVDLKTPRETCAVCHTGSANTPGRDARFMSSSSNCISCHVQHPYSAGRWSEFMTEDAIARRRGAVANKIQQLTNK